MINKLPQINFVFDRHKTASPTRKGTVEMRISYNYKKKYISTGVLLYPHQWKNGMIVECTDIVQISQVLDKLLKDVRQIIYKMMEDGYIDLSAIPDRLQDQNSEKLTFLTFCEQRAAVRKYGKEADTQERYSRFIRLFRKWGGIVEFEDITERNIILLDSYLFNKGMKPYSKWNNYHRFLNSFILDAIDAGYLKKNPYKWVNIEKGKTSESISKHLTPDEFYRIKRMPMPTKSIDRVRDIFVFQTYTCLSYSDLRDFDYRFIQEVKGMNVYVGRRHKTKMSFTIPLLSSAIDILHKYEGRLPIISNVKYNEYLKVVAQSAGVDRPISSHWARHTGATLLLNEGVDMRIVSKICGHSSTRITEQVYAKLLDETVVDAISSINI